ncbi:P-II family nitrogen regulator [Heliobacterium undosum]|uniref:P-II family nitrogen regulator n=1 Tax=Heliomicrobium undosum TaxID=121734 RepID=A0A845LDA5_9FIRM|nr:P-II family nitrogen regulator [Heliomicrobium undosum]MZP30901.1 P-II family nitrogen regulator [Heliomicrobium undosum]
MKKIEAVFRPERLDLVKQRLEAIGIRGMTLTQVMGCGRQKGETGVYRGQEYAITLRTKVKLELAVSDGEVETVVQTIVEAARTGQVGDGKIFILPIEEAVRIRTGERGAVAL